MAEPKTSLLLWSRVISVRAVSFFFAPASSRSKLRLNSKSFSSAAPWAGETSSSSAKLASRVSNLPPCRAGSASQHPSTNWNSIATTIFPATNSASNFRSDPVLSHGPRSASLHSIQNFHRHSPCTLPIAPPKLYTHGNCRLLQPLETFLPAANGDVTAEMVKKLFCGAAVLALCVFYSAAAWGQAQFTTGSVQGDVLDEKGGSVAGASVEAKNLDTNYVRTESTNSDGHFQFLNLAPGHYTLTISKPGFTTIVQEKINLTVGQNLSIPVTVKVSSVAQQIVVSDVPVIEVTKTESSSTLEEAAIASTPVLGRKFEDLLTLTPGVSISQGPDGDEININGQRGIFNNIRLDGGDYNNGFFGEQVGGQRAAVDISLEAVKEFQIVATGASAEFGRTAGGVVNVITKSGTNDIHGSVFHYQRLEALTSNTSDGKPLQDFRREQSGGSIGGPIVRDKAFFFGTFEQIFENLRRDNLGTAIGTPCSISAPVVGVNDTAIAGSADCQRVALVNFFGTRFGQDEKKPVIHSINNSAALGRFDWNLTPKNSIGVSYNFDYSKNTNQTFDVPTYGNSANGIEGPSKINVVNGNLFTTVSATKLNEFHMSYSRENRPRNAVSSKVPDTAMGFATTFRFGQPYFLEPAIDELFWRTDLSDKFSIIKCAD